jgi:nitroreductase
MLKHIRTAVRALNLDDQARAAYGWYHSWKRSCVWPLQLSVMRLMARWEWTSTLYYAFGSSAFRREHQAILAGRVRYYDRQRSGETAVYLLRRNIHRIEKGLVMRPRRPVFAIDYIEETTASYCNLAGADGCEAVQDELLWARDVLDTYFCVSGEHAAVDACRASFAAVGMKREMQRMVPYKRDLSSAPVSFDDLHALSRRRRSVRVFKQIAVPRELIDKALSVAVQAPSACNRQPYRFRIFDTAERVLRIASIPMGTTGFSDQIPSIAVMVGEQGAFFDERDRHVIYIDASLAAMSFLFALETLGLSSCCINWPDIGSKEVAMRRELGLRDDERVIMLIAIGYPDPDGMVPYSQKKALTQVRTYNE